MAENTVNVSFKGADQPVRAHVKPGETLVFNNVDFDNVKIDIIGPDVILTNPADNARIFLPGLGLILFSADDAPTLMMADGTVITPQMILSKVGTIQNVTQEDFLTFTSLDINPEQGADQLNLSDLEANRENEELKRALNEKTQELEEQSAKLEDATEDLFNIASYMEEFTSNLEGENSARLRETDENDETTPENDTIEAIQNSRAEFIEDATGALTSRPSQPVSPGTPEQFNNPETNDGEDGVSGALASFEFSADLFQVGAVNTLGVDNTYRGGGGSEVAVFDARPAAQYAREIIDTTDQVVNHTIYADNEVLFDAATAARMLQLDPSTPAGFDVTQLTISGIPNSADYDLGTFDSSTNTFTPLVRTGSDYVITNAAILDDGSGSIQLVLQYTIPSTPNPTSFDLDIEMVSEYDPLSGQPAPSAGQETQTFALPTFTVNVKDVNSSGDVANGEYALSNIPNNNQITTSDNDVIIYGGQGVDTITTGAGEDIIYASGGNDVIDVNGGIDLIDFSNITDNVTATLDTDENSGNGISGTAAFGGYTQTLNDFENITGGDGDDTLTGSTLANTIIGGEGNDTIQGLNGNDTLTGGNGTDTLDYSYAGVGITANLNSATITVVGGTDVDTISGFENITATDFNDVLTGTGSDNVINAGGGNDTINAGGGNDTINAGSGDDTITASAGNDTIDGGADTDTLDYSAFANGITVTIDDGAGFATLTSGAETDMIRNIENITGTNQADNITGDSSDETFRGNGGDDIIDGGLGNDTIYGGLGSDNLTGGGGTGDILRFDDLAVGLTDFNAGTGSATTAASGNDTFTGFESYILTNQADSITASNGNDTIDGGGGTDTINYSAAGSALNINLNLTTGTVTGYGTDNLSNIENVIGGSGNDTIQGRAGVNNALDGGAGTGDILSYTYTSAAVTYNMTSMNASGFLITIGAEQDRAQNFEIIQGSGGVDNFTGDANDNTFFGNNGNDDVTASLGDDTYNGGTGSDILRYNSASFNTFGITVDLAVDAGSGYSEVIFAGGLGDTHLIQGFTEINATNDDDDIRGTATAEIFRGNSGNDTIYGRGGNDTLEGDDGADTLYGGDGNDTLRGEGTAGDQLFGEAGDDVLYADNAGNDAFDGGTTVEVNGDTVNYSAVTGGVSVSLLAGTDDDGNTLTNIENIVGTNAADTITGDANDNTLDGSGGNDTLIGSAGDDTLIGGTGTDTVDYNGASGAIDVDLTAGTASDDGEGDTDTFSSIENIIGSDFDDTIKGSSGSNDLYGGDGNDTFLSSGGNDDYFGGNDTTGDTVDYSGEVDQIYYQSQTNTLYKFDDFGQDSFNGIEQIIGTNNADEFVIRTFDSDLIDFTNGIDGNGGNDTIYTSDLLLDSDFNAVEADFFASIFTDIEQIDFSGATLTDGSFVFTGEDIMNLTADANGTLNVTVDSGFTLAFSASGGYDNAGGVYSGAGTYTFTNGGDSVDLVVAVNA